MDYMIYRKADNDFMRWDDKQIFVTADREEIGAQYGEEQIDNTNPILLTISYKHYYNSDCDEMESVTIRDEETNKRIGFFTYQPKLGDYDNFYDALNEWAEGYIEDNNKTNK